MFDHEQGFLAIREAELQRRAFPNWSLGTSWNESKIKR